MHAKYPNLFRRLHLALDLEGARIAPGHSSLYRRMNSRNDLTSLFLMLPRLSGALFAWNIGFSGDERSTWLIPHRLRQPVHGTEHRLLLLPARSVLELPQLFPLLFSEQLLHQIQLLHRLLRHGV